MYCDARFFDANDVHEPRLPQLEAKSIFSGIAHRRLISRA
jgi:hypothetical protein